MDEAEDRFTEDEIIQQLLQLGYENISEETLRMFQEDLRRLQTTAEFESEKEIRHSPATATLHATHTNSDSTTNEITYSPASQSSKFRCQRTIPIRIEKLGPERKESEAHHIRHYQSFKSFEQLTPFTPEMSSYFGFAADESSSQRPSTQRIRKILRRSSNGEQHITSEIVTPASNGGSSTSEMSSPVLFDDEQIYDSSDQLSVESTISKSVQPKRICRSTCSTQPLQRYRYRRNSLLDACRGSQSLHGNLALKTDCVALYHYYKDGWDKFTIPSKENHTQQRRDIRNKMSNRN